MRNIFIVLLACIICGNTTLAQKSANIPAAVKTAFTKANPGITKVKWEKEGNYYEASFYNKGNDMSLLYNADGTVVETETSIAITALPAAALKYATRKGKITEAARIVLANGTVHYEAEVNKKDLLFDDQGNFLSKKTD